MIVLTLIKYTTYQHPLAILLLYHAISYKQSHLSSKHAKVMYCDFAYVQC